MNRTYDLKLMTFEDGSIRVYAPSGDYWHVNNESDPVLKQIARNCLNYDVQNIPNLLKSLDLPKTLEKPDA